MKSLETMGLYPEEIREACDRIASSPIFENSSRMVRFLRFVVEKALAGHEDEIKEYLLGVEVFDRHEAFDPKTDTIVRVEARRLRRKLGEYYQGHGAGETVRIEMPSPGYVPVFSRTAVPDSPNPDPASNMDAPRPRASWIGARGVALFLAGIAVVAAAASVLWWRGDFSRAAGIDSIAVLPFSDMSAARDQEYFCDGFTEELISTLASVEGLRVVARTSAFTFKNKAGDIREIGRRLNAGVVLEGSVRRSAGTLRITAQMIRASDGYHLWAKSYESKAEDVLVTQREIAQQIAGTLSKRLAADGGAGRRPNLEAHELYLLGRYHWNRMQTGDLEKAIAYFENAIALQPDSARAYSGLADAYSYLIDIDAAPTSQILPKARAAADKALELDPNLAEAHTARGLVAHELEWDQDRARKEFTRAIELKPSYAYGIHWYAHFLEFAGRAGEAEAAMGRALAIDPLSRVYTIDLAMIHYKQRRFDEALRQIDKARELDPEYYLLDISRALVFAARHDWPNTQLALTKAAARMGDEPLVIGLRAQSEALAGDRVMARKHLAELEKVAAKTYVPDYLFALVHYSLNQPELGRSFLKKAVDAHSGLLVWLKTTALFDQIAADPEGNRLLRQAGGQVTF